MGRFGDRIGMTVTIGGTDQSAKVERVRCRFGWDQRVCECDGDFPLSLPYPSGYETLLVQAGLTADSILHPVSDTFGPSTTRFNGLVINTAVQHWPYTMKPQGRGWLTLADRLTVPDDAWANYLNPFVNPNPLATPSKYDPPGIDMTNNGAGQTDSAQVLYVLNAAGLTPRIQTYPSDIGGLPYLLGTQVKAFEQFVWRRGQSGLQYIESLDAMYGFRTFENPSGYIVRQLTSTLVPQFSTVQYTLNENTDIIEGASITRDIENVRNRIEVQGWDPGDGSNVWAAFGSASPLPPGITLVSETFSSSLVEKFQQTDAGDGLACDTAANYWRQQLQYPMLEAVVPTWRDDPFKPGDVVYLNAPHLLGVNQAMRLKHLEIEVTPTTFTQYLTLRAQDYAVYRGPPVLPFTMGAFLRVGP